MKPSSGIPQILIALSVLLSLVFGPLGKLPGLEPVDAVQADINGGGGSFLAIVDLYVSNRGSANPNLFYPEYTALNWNIPFTSPYINGSVGTFVPAADINWGIGGDFTYIWVKYAWVAPTDNTPVLVDLAVHHWPYWNVSCPQGWTAARGDKGGALTTGSDDACWRNGLCVHFVPMNQTETFITTLGISFHNYSEPAVAPLAPANGGYWPMVADTLDIHMGCGDGWWMFLNYNHARKWTAMPVTLPSPPDPEKASILSTYAPLVWQAIGEIYFPSSVEWSFKHLDRVWGTGPAPDPPIPAHWLVTKESFDPPSDVLDYFHGCDGASTGNPCQLGEAPVYAFWDEVDVNVDVNGTITPVKVVDLIYFFYYPYNRGKELVNTIWGNHVGDWEHISIRMIPFWEEGKGWTYKPVQVYLSIHDFGMGFFWEQVPKGTGEAIFLPLITKSGITAEAVVSEPDILNTASFFDPLNTHPVIYQAWGSHGIWPQPGAFVYKQTPVGDLVDFTSPGSKWKTWRNVVAFNFDTLSGLSGNIWPNWMRNDYFTFHGTGDPASGAIYRWGNPKMDPCAFGYCQLENGPTGPIDKGVFNSQSLK